jgi:prepilin-type processing-associated H-X9-DG protein
VAGIQQDRRRRIGRMPHYAANAQRSRPGRLAPDGGSTVGPMGRAQSLVEPTSTLLLWEHNMVAPYCEAWASLPDHWATPHHDGLNVVYADGRVKRLTIAQVTEPMLTYWDDERIP